MSSERPNVGMEAVGALIIGGAIAVLGHSALKGFDATPASHQAGPQTNQRDINQLPRPQHPAELAGRSVVFSRVNVHADSNPTIEITAVGDNVFPLAAIH